MDSRGLGEHTVQRYDLELETLRSKVLRLGGLVEEQLAAALAAVETQDGELASRVVSDDREVNALELELDQACAMVLARRAPVAADLRLVIGTIKTVNDLERMGDEAARIARMAVNMSARGSSARCGDLRHLGSRVQAMLRAALDAFARTDPEAAVNVVEADREVDREYESLSREVITFMMEDSRLIPRGLDLQFAARALERIGDRAGNIGEYVIYIVKGADVRHAPLEDKRSTVEDDG